MATPRVLRLSVLLTDAVEGGVKHGKDEHDIDAACVAESARVGCCVHPAGGEWRAVECVRGETTVASAIAAAIGCDVRDSIVTTCKRTSEAFCCFVWRRMALFSSPLPIFEAGGR